MPDIILEEEVRAALGGEPAALWSAFAWEETEQGHEFWEKEAESDSLSDEDRSILNGCLAGSAQGEAAA